MRSMSPAALQAMFGQESDATLITLLTLTAPGLGEPVYLTDNYTQRVYETEEHVVYGVKSRGIDFLFMPLQISLPTEEEAAPRASISIHDVTREVMPIIRSVTGYISVNLELVLSTSPDVVEASFPGFVMTGLTYNANTITGELSVEGLALEPFPAYSFTPPYFPGLF